VVTIIFHVGLALRCENDGIKSGQRGDPVEPRFFLEEGGCRTQ
jgi:hypothetical protein